MSLDLLAGEKCGLDVYEEPSEEVYVSCRTTIARYGAGIMAGFIIVIVVVLIAMFGTGKYLVVPAMLLLIIAVGTYYAGSLARINYRQTQREIQSYMTNGKTRAEAVDTLREERLRRETNEALRRSRK